MPGCVLRVGGDEFSPAQYLSLFPRARVSLHGNNLNITVSERGGSEFLHQVQDAIDYLNHHGEKIEKLLALSSIRATLDFGVWREDKFSQCFYFPPFLIGLAGNLGLGLELSVYASS